MNSAVWQNFPTVVLLVDSTDTERLSKLADLVEARQNHSRLLVLLTKQDRVSERPWLDENPGLCPAEVSARLGLLNEGPSHEGPCSHVGPSGDLSKWAVMGICLDDGGASMRPMESFAFPGAELVLDWLREPEQDKRFLLYNRGWYA